MRTRDEPSDIGRSVARLNMLGRKDDGSRAVRYPRTVARGRLPAFALAALAAHSQPREAPSSAVAQPAPRSSEVDAAPPAVALTLPAVEADPEPTACGSV